MHTYDWSHYQNSKNYFGEICKTLGLVGTETIYSESLFYIVDILFYCFFKLKQYPVFVAEDYIYWADNDGGFITRVKQDMTHREVVVKGVENIEGFSIDWVAGKKNIDLIYFNIQ